MEKNNKVPRNNLLNNKKNKLLYDPNERINRRLGNFSMTNDNEKEEKENNDNQLEEKSENNKALAKMQEEETQKNNKLINLQNRINKQNKKQQAEKELKSRYKKLKEIKKAKFVFKLSFLLPFLPVILLILIVFALFLNESNSDPFEFGNTQLGLSGYTYLNIGDFCEKVKVYNPKTGTYTAELDFETEYIPGVVAAEVGGFSDAPDVLKLFSVAARSFGLKSIDKSSCTIEGSARRQAFTFDKETLAKVTSESSPIRQAADATYGLVIGRNNELMTVHYDAACYRGQDNDYYHIGYGSADNGVERIQKIPKSWAQTKSGLMSYINKSISVGKMCYNNHGYGISQYGAYYLATQENYDFNQLINFYLDNVTIYSIYENVNFTSNITLNYTTETSNGTNDIISTNLRTFLQNKNTSVQEFNEYILENIASAGYGTREGAIAAAVSLVGGLYQNYHVRIPYTMSGQHGGTIPSLASGHNLNHLATSFYGVDPEWGTRISNRSDGTFHYGSYSYLKYGPDCSGFVAWVLHNAGFDVSVLGANAFGQIGTQKSLNGTRVGNPGDLMWKEGHIMFIVGVDDNAKKYYVAHASSGSQGTKISTVDFNSSSNKVVDMTNWYAQHKHNFASMEEFVTTYRNGYLDGYTGPSTMPSQNNAEPTKDRIITKNDLYFVGDSRTVGVCTAAQFCEKTNSCNTNSCVAKVGASYSWFTKQINQINTTSKNTILILMGVNDLVGQSTDGAIIVADKYFEEFKKVADANPSKTFYIVSVNPVNEGASVSIDAIKAYNNRVIELINSSGKSNIRYLDTYDKINYSIAKDGIHYNMKTYGDIYNYIVNTLTS